MTCSKGTLSAFVLDANILSISCSTGEFLSDFVKIIITAILSVATFVDCYASRHRRSLANNTGGGGNIDLGVRSQVWKRGEIGFDQYLTYIHPFPQLSSQFCFICLLSTQQPQKNVLRKILGKGHLALPLSSYTNASRHAAYDATLAEIRAAASGKAWRGTPCIFVWL
jgi:hypothetical protein